MRYPNPRAPQVHVFAGVCVDRVPYTVPAVVGATVRFHLEPAFILTGGRPPAGWQQARADSQRAAQEQSTTRIRAALPFVPENEIDLVLGYANPNPERTGCPPRDALAMLARRERDIGDPRYEHLRRCHHAGANFVRFNTQQVNGGLRLRSMRGGDNRLAVLVACGIAPSEVAYQRTRPAPCVCESMRGHPARPPQVLGCQGRRYNSASSRSTSRRGRLAQCTSLSSMRSTTRTT